MTDRVHFDDLTKINVPFGLLDDNTQERLRAHGGPYEAYNDIDLGWGAWRPSWSLVAVYRVAPQKPRPLVVKDWAMLADWVRYVTRDADGFQGFWKQKPKTDTNADGFWVCEEGTRQKMIPLHSPTLIDPGDCDWTEAIDCRDNPNSAE